MKLATGTSNFFTLSSFLRLGFLVLLSLYNGHLSCAYDGQSTRKCLTSSLGCPQAGQLAPVTLPILFRYAFSGTCPVLSWQIRLASSLESLSSLISFRNVFEGSEESMALILLYLADTFHSCAHLFLSRLLFSCFRADLFCLSCFLNSGRRDFLSDVFPSVALFASVSASSFPSIPM